MRYTEPRQKIFSGIRDKLLFSPFGRYMKRPRFSVSIKRLLLELFAQWAVPFITAYREGGRAGVRKGEKIRLSRSKYFCALLQALHGPLSLSELSRASFLIDLKEINVTGASTDLISKWRTEKQFRDEAEKASRDFPDALLSKILHYEYNFDDLKDLTFVSILIEALILLPGFNIADNLLLDEINKLILQTGDFEAINDPKENGVIIQTLDRYLTIYAYIVDVMHEYIDEREVKDLKRKVHDLIYAIRPNIENLVKKMESSITIDDNKVGHIFNILRRLGGLMKEKEKGGL